MATHGLASFSFLFIIVDSFVESCLVLFILPDLLEMYLPTVDEVDLISLYCTLQYRAVCNYIRRYRRDTHTLSCTVTEQHS